MSSSDSEDDSFLNPTQKLDAMINNYNVDTDLQLNDCLPPDIPVCSPAKNKPKNKSPAKAKRKISTDSCSSDSIDLETFRSAFPPIDNAKPRRNTRSAAKKNSAQNSPNPADIQKSLPKRKRKSVATELAGNSNETIVPPTPTSPTPAPPVRGRGRGRARGRRGRNSMNTRRSRSGGPSILDILQAMIPIYSVGNTDDYPDQCDDQQLFSNRKPDDVVEVEDLNESLEENELMSVKVEWMSASIFKFDLRKYQKLTPIFEHFSKEEKVSYDKLYFSYNGKIIKPDDTPDSIDYSIVKFIDGGIVRQSVTHLASNNVEDKDGVKLKFQCQNVKKPFEITIRPDDKMATAMLQCAEHFEQPLDKLRFEFDGDIISGKSTPRDLDLEDGGCIDKKTRETQGNNDLYVLVIETLRRKEDINEELGLIDKLIKNLYLPID